MGTATPPMPGRRPGAGGPLRLLLGPPMALQMHFARQLVALAESPPPLSGAAGTRWLHGASSGEPGEDEAVPYADVPRPGRKWERKPYVTPMKVLIRRAKEERRIRQENPCRVLEHPPDNGLLVPHLVKVAHRVYASRERLLDGLTKLVEGEAAMPVKRCRFCAEVHVGRVGHEIRTCKGRDSAARNSLHVWRPGTVRDVVGFPYCYHLFDRVGRPRVVHKEKYDVPRLPAILELCIQAGMDVECYPTKRRTRPVYSIEGRITDFEPDEGDNSEAGMALEPACTPLSFVPVAPIAVSSIPADGANGEGKVEEEITMQELASRTLQSWLDMRSGTARLMKKYRVNTCGYCLEVQVGPKGHKVRICRATKHQQRDGQHAWQEANGGRSDPAQLCVACCGRRRLTAAAQRAEAVLRQGPRDSEAVRAGWRACARGVPEHDVARRCAACAGRVRPCRLRVNLPRTYMLLSLTQLVTIPNFLLSIA